MVQSVDTSEASRMFLGSKLLKETIDELYGFNWSKLRQIVIGYVPADRGKT